LRVAEEFGWKLGSYGGQILTICQRASEKKTQVKIVDFHQFE